MEALNAITLKEIHDELRYLDKLMLENIRNEIAHEALHYSYRKWEKLIEPVMSGQIILDRPQ